MRKHECFNCDYKTNCKTYSPTKEMQNIYLCHICANTGLSYAQIYPTNYTAGESTMMRSVAYIGNLLLDEIKKSK